MRQPTDREALSEGLLMRMRAHIVRRVRRADVEINRETGLVEIPTPDLGAPMMQATGTAVQRAHPLIVEITPGVFRWAEKKDAPRRTVIVGHVNPYTPAPAFALADAPHHSSGDRLRRALGLSRESWWGLLAEPDLREVEHGQPCGQEGEPPCPGANHPQPEPCPPNREPCNLGCCWQAGRPPPDGEVVID